MLGIWNCLNPCCNGIYSMRYSWAAAEARLTGLNPCCNGIYSMSASRKEAILRELQS